MKRLGGYVLFFIIILLLILSTQVSFVFPQEKGRFLEGTEPDGFRGIKWGTNIHTLKDMDYFMTHDLAPIKFYIRRGEEPPSDRLRVGGVTVSAILYGFEDGKLCDIRIMSFGYDRFWALLLSASGKFGEPAKAPGIEFYGWFGNKTIVTIEYDTGKNESQLRLFSPTYSLKGHRKEREKGW